MNTLLAFDADPNIVDSSGYLAIDHVRSAGTCKSILEADSRFWSNPFKKGRGVLHNMVMTDTPGEVVDILVNAGADINALTFDLETPLVNAIYWGRTKVANRLIALGADISVGNISSQEGPKHLAGNFDGPEMLPLLLQRGAYYTAADIHGRDLGHCAALFADVEFIDVMARSNLKKLNLDKRDRDGKTEKNYMNGRIILKDREIGIHEAFEALAVSLSPFSTIGVQRAESLDELKSQIRMVTGVQPPGAFPSE